MKIKIFDTSEEANAFIDTVVMDDYGQIQYTADGKIAVFYDVEKSNYKDYLVDRTIERVERSLFNQQTNQVAATAEVETFRDEGGKSKDFDEAMEKRKGIDQGVKVLQRKLAALEAWKTKHSSNE